MSSPITSLASSNLTSHSSTSHAKSFRSLKISLLTLVVVVQCGSGSTHILRNVNYIEIWLNQVAIVATSDPLHPFLLVVFFLERRLLLK